MSYTPHNQEIGKETRELLKAIDRFCDKATARIRDLNTWSPEHRDALRSIRASLENATELIHAQNLEGSGWE